MITYDFEDFDKGPCICFSKSVSAVEIFGTSGNDCIRAFGTTGEQAGASFSPPLEGLKGFDYRGVLYGGGGNDTILVECATNPCDLPFLEDEIQIVVRGGDGNDLLKAYNLADAALQGESDDDILMVEKITRNAILEGGDGDDTCSGKNNEPDTVTIGGDCEK